MSISSSKRELEAAQQMRAEAEKLYIQLKAEASNLEDLVCVFFLNS